MCVCAVLGNEGFGLGKENFKVTSGEIIRIGEKKRNRTQKSNVTPIRDPMNSTLGPKKLGNFNFGRRGRGNGVVGTICPIEPRLRNDPNDRNMKIY